MSYVVVIEKHSSVECFGLYRSFKRASDDAKAIPADKGKAFVLPVQPKEKLP